MLYVYFGDDRNKVRTAVQNFVAKQEGLGFLPERYDETNWMDIDLSALTSSNDLFGITRVVVLDDVFSDEVYRESVLKLAEEFKSSKNIFVIVAEKIDAPTKKVLAKSIDAMEEFATDKNKKKKEIFNVFSLSDALGARDKKNLWVGLVRAREAGKSSEEIVGTLFWQLKVLLLVMRGEDKTLNPFVVSKARANSKKYTEKDVLNMMHTLLKVYHDARRGKVEMDIGLERFCLRV